VAVGLGLVAAVLAATDSRQPSALRHAYLVPVLAAGLRFGVAGGGLGALAAVLLESPRLFVHVEREGLTPAIVEAGITLASLPALGCLVGGLAQEARRQRGNYGAVLAAQAALAGEDSLAVALVRLRAALGLRLGADVAIVARDDSRLVTAGPVSLDPESPALTALTTGRPVFVPDTGAGPRPLRCLAAPLLARGEPVGALVVEREGELGGGERRAIAGLAVHLGLVLENARLASRQRRFADELADKVAAATGRLEAMDRAKSALLALASHELRTPLTALLGFSELLASRAFASAEVRRLADIMRRETERLTRLVDDFLDLARLERGLTPRLAPVPVAVGPAVAAAVELFRRGRVTHPIRVDCDEPLPAVRADPDALDRVLKNLLSNAIKYSPAGSEVRVSVRAGPGSVCVSVEDRGRGIAADVLPRIFEPYFRAPDASHAAGGTGLGLAVVKSIVEAHGGQIHVESAPGAGTRIAFQLPAVP
jgi:signal transduction histidine kinase